MKKISALALALLLALQLSAGAASLQVATTGTVSGLANNQQINVIAGNLATMIESASAPTTTSTGLSSTAGVWWHDTGNKIIFVRDQADANWLPVFYLDETGHLIGTSGQAGAWVTVGGTGNAVTLTYPVAPAAYPQGMKLAFKATAANTGPMTVNANSLGNKNVFKKSASGPVALTGAEIQIGDLVELESDGTQLQIISSLPTTPFAGGTLTSTTTMSGAAFNEAPFVTIASAATTDISGAASNNVVVTGSATITSFGAALSGARRTVFFQSGVAGLVNSGTLVLPGGANITTTAGDVAEFKSQGGAWVCISYTKANGQALVPAFDGTAKAWVSFGPTGTILTSFNVASVTRNGLGDFTVTFTTAFASANYVMSGNAWQSGATVIRPTSIFPHPSVTPAAGSMRLLFADAIGGVNVDPTQGYAEFHGR